MNHCNLGVGCEESGMCYAEAHGEPRRCGRGNIVQFPSTNVPAHKQQDARAKPGQIVNPIPESLLYKPAHGGYPDPKKDQQ
jgi:hypothetical protein